MLFSGIPFIFYFLPAVLIMYYLMPGIKGKNTVLLIFSLVFYGWGEPRYIALMILSVFCGYVFGILTENSVGKKRKIYMIISVMISLSFLLYFKYADFFIDGFNKITGLKVPLLKVTLPIGISFYTFQIISYNIDVYRGDVKARKNPLTLALYISMFPQLIAGPIVRYSDIKNRLETRDINVEKISLGIRRFVMGLGKKILIANVLGEFCESFLAGSDISVLYIWAYTIANALQIYFDFSGYSDMAIGLGHMLGFDFPGNFDYPFIASSVTEFWRRWHISLGTWFRDYVYIPLGGNRVGKIRHIVNIMTVWFLTGFWHGAGVNFIMWGVYFGIILIIEKNFLMKYLRKSKVVSRLYVIPLILISFLIFSVTDISRLVYYIRGMLFMGGLPVISAEFSYYAGSFAVITAIAVFASTPVMKNAVNKLREKPAIDKIIDILEPVFLSFVAILCIAYLVDGSFNPFLYFRF